jgi:ubiquinone/menaquinone biosynthesis C-methylase UbiE
MIAPPNQKQDPDLAAQTVRTRYNRVARVYDIKQLIEEPLISGRLRRALWAEAPATGRILEVGVGTGVNMKHYPPSASMTAIDISDRMLAKAQARADRNHIAVDLALMDAQALNFADNTFDAIVATCVFCSVPDPVAGLREILRVLKPGGKLLLIEHVRSGNPVMGKLMDILNPVAVRLSGANINRRTVENVRAAGFDELDVTSHTLGFVKTIRTQKGAATAA